MAKLINLRRERKRRVRADKSNAAEKNRQANLVTARDIKSSKLRNELEAKRLEAHKLERNPDA